MMIPSFKHPSQKALFFVLAVSVYAAVDSALDERLAAFRTEFFNAHVTPCHGQRSVGRQKYYFIRVKAFNIGYSRNAHILPVFYYNITLFLRRNLFFFH